MQDLSPTLHLRQQRLPNLDAHIQALPLRASSHQGQQEGQGQGKREAPKRKSSWFSKSNRRSIRALFTRAPKQSEQPADLWANTPSDESTSHNISDELQGVLHFLLTDETSELERGLVGWEQFGKLGCRRGSENKANGSTAAVGWTKSDPDTVSVQDDSSISSSVDIKRSRVSEETSALQPQKDSGSGEVTCKTSYSSPNKGKKSPRSPVRTLSPMLVNRNKKHGTRSDGRRATSPPSLRDIANRDEKNSLDNSTSINCANDNLLPQCSIQTQGHLSSFSPSNDGASKICSKSESVSTQSRHLVKTGNTIISTRTLDAVQCTLVPQHNAFSTGLTAGRNDIKLNPLSISGLNPKLRGFLNPVLNMSSETHDSKQTIETMETGEVMEEDNYGRIIQKTDGKHTIRDKDAATCDKSSEAVGHGSLVISNSGTATGACDTIADASTASSRCSAAATAAVESKLRCTSGQACVRSEASFDTTSKQSPNIWISRHSCPVESQLRTNHSQSTDLNNDYNFHSSAVSSSINSGGPQSKSNPSINPKAVAVVDATEIKASINIGNKEICSAPGNMHRQHMNSLEIDEIYCDNDTTANKPVGYTPYNCNGDRTSASVKTLGNSAVNVMNVEVQGNSTSNTKLNQELGDEENYDGEFLRPTLNYNSLNWKRKDRSNVPTISGSLAISQESIMRSNNGSLTNGRSCMFNTPVHPIGRTPSFDRWSVGASSLEERHARSSFNREMFDSDIINRDYAKSSRGIAKSNTFTSFGDVASGRNPSRERESSNKKKKKRRECSIDDYSDDDIGSFSSFSMSDSATSAGSKSFFSRLKDTFVKRGNHKRSKVERSGSNTSKCSDKLSTNSQNIDQHSKTSQNSNRHSASASDDAAEKNSTTSKEGKEKGLPKSSSFLGRLRRGDSKSKHAAKLETEGKHSGSVKRSKSEIEKLAELADSIAASKARQNAEHSDALFKNQHGMNINRRDFSNSVDEHSGMRRNPSVNWPMYGKPISNQQVSAEIFNYSRNGQKISEEDAEINLDYEVKNDEIKGLPYSKIFALPQGMVSTTNTLRNEFKSPSVLYRCDNEANFSYKPSCDLSSDNSSSAHTRHPCRNSVDANSCHSGTDSQYGSTTPSNYLTWPPKGVKRIRRSSLFTAIIECESPTKSGLAPPIALEVAIDNECDPIERATSPGKRSFQEFNEEDGVVEIRTRSRFDPRCKHLKRDSQLDERDSFSPRHNSFKGTERSSIAIRTFFDSCESRHNPDIVSENYVKRPVDNVFQDSDENMHAGVMQVEAIVHTQQEPSVVPNTGGVVLNKYVPNICARNTWDEKIAAVKPDIKQMFNKNRLIEKPSKSGVEESLQINKVADPLNRSVNPGTNTANMARLEEIEQNLQLLLRDEAPKSAALLQSSGCNEAHQNENQFNNKSSASNLSTRINLIHNGVSKVQPVSTVSPTVNINEELHFQINSKNPPKYRPATLVKPDVIGSNISSGMKHSVTFPAGLAVGPCSSTTLSDKKKRVSFHPLVVEETISPSTEYPPPPPPPPLPVRQLFNHSQVNRTQEPNSMSHFINYNVRPSWECYDGRVEDIKNYQVGAPSGLKPSCSLKPVSKRLKMLNDEPEESSVVPIHEMADLNQISNDLEKESDELQSIIDSLQSTSISTSKENSHITNIISKPQQTSSISTPTSSERENQYEQIMSWFEWSNLVSATDGVAGDLHGGNHQGPLSQASDRVKSSGVGTSNAAQKPKNVTVFQTSSSQKCNDKAALPVNDAERKSNTIYQPLIINEGERKSSAKLVNRTNRGGESRNTGSAITTAVESEVYSEGKYVFTNLNKFHRQKSSFDNPEKLILENAIKDKSCSNQPDYVTLQDVLSITNKIKPPVPPKPLRTDYITLEELLSDGRRGTDRMTDDKTITSSSSSDSVNTLTDLRVTEDCDVADVSIRTRDVIDFSRNGFPAERRRRPLRTNPKRSHSSPSLTPDLDKHKEPDLVQKSGSEICCVSPSEPELLPLRVETNNFAFVGLGPQDYFVTRRSVSSLTSCTGSTNTRDNHLRISDCGLFSSSGESFCEPVNDSEACGEKMRDDTAKSLEENLIRRSCGSPSTSSGFGSAVVLCLSDVPNSPI